MYIASMPRKNPPHTAATSWKGLQMTPDHESARMSAQTTAVAMT